MKFIHVFLALVMVEMTIPHYSCGHGIVVNNLPAPTCRGQARQQNKHLNVSSNSPFPFNSTAFVSLTAFRLHMQKLSASNVGWGAIVTYIVVSILIYLLQNFRI
jgi:hypothetical protein